MTLDDQASKVVDFKIVWSSSPTSSNYKSYFSTPEFIEFPTQVSGEKAYAYYYPPTNPKYQASQEEKPPLLLQTHGNYYYYYFFLTVILSYMYIRFYISNYATGGPTDEAHGILNLNIQFWTSRGWAFVDVNYGGSTGMFLT